MITNFKIYERFNEGKPEVGDYVICSGEFWQYDDVSPNNIGQITIIDEWQYEITYKFNDHHYYYCNLEDIKYWSKDKKELDMILNTKKFNI